MIVLDTNILIAYLAGESSVVRFVDEVRSQGEHLAISVVAQIELLSSPELQSGEEILIDRILESLEVVTITPHLGRMAARIRRETGLKLGDSIIGATAQFWHALLVTRDRELTKKLKKVGINVRTV